MSGGHRGPPAGREPAPVNYLAIQQAREPLAAGGERSHDRLRPERLSGWIGLELTAIDLVHVGSGAPVLYDEIVRSTMVTVDARGGAGPVIPGSSLKGAVRNLAELLLGGGAPDDYDVARTAVGGLFGYIAGDDTFAARIGFDDAMPNAEEPAFGVTKLPHPFQPRKRVGRRIYGPPVGILAKEVPYEVIVQGERFRTRLHMINLEREELGAVLTCLGMDGTFHLRIGGAKFAGLGRVHFEATGASLRRGRGYEQPWPERLDAEAAQRLVSEAISLRRLARDGEAPLAQIRKTLGGAR